MAGCVLRVDGVFTGAELPREFRPLDVVVRRHGDGVVHLTDAEDLKVQCDVAESFLLENSNHLRSLSQNPLVEGLTLDFGLWQKDALSQFSDFPASVVSAAGTLSVGLSASLYLCGDDDEA